MNILIAEDDTTSRTVLRMLLIQAGHAVTEASDGARALALALESSFDLALLDARMPALGGLDVIRAVREDERGTARHLPFIVLSAGDGFDDARRCLAAGADRYLQKPVTRQNLLAALDGMPAGEVRPLEVAAGSAAAMPGPESPAVARLMDLTGVDAGTARGLVETALTYLPDTCSRIRRAIADRDLAALEASAHALGGSSALFDPSLQILSRELEAAARAADWNPVPAAMTALERTLAALEAELTSFLELPRRRHS